MTSPPASRIYGLIHHLFQESINQRHISTTFPRPCTAIPHGAELHRLPGIRFSCSAHRPSNPHQKTWRNRQSGTILSPAARHYLRIAPQWFFHGQSDRCKPYLRIGARIVREDERSHLIPHHFQLILGRGCTDDMHISHLQHLLSASLFLRNDGSGSRTFAAAPFVIFLCPNIFRFHPNSLALGNELVFVGIRRIAHRENSPHHRHRLNEFAFVQALRPQIRCQSAHHRQPHSTQRRE